MDYHKGVELKMELDKDSRHSVISETDYNWKLQDHFFLDMSGQEKFSLIDMQLQLSKYQQV